MKYSLSIEMTSDKQGNTQRITLGQISHGYIRLLSW